MKYWSIGEDIHISPEKGYGKVVAGPAIVWYGKPSEADLVVPVYIVQTPDGAFSIARAGASC